MSREVPRIKRYFTLRAIRTLYRLLAIAVVLFWIVFIVVTAFAAEDKGLYVQSMIVPTIQAVIVALSFYAVAQVLDVMLSINENQRQLAIQNRTLMRGIKRMLARMDDLEKKQMELHERQHRILKKIDPGHDCGGSILMKVFLSYSHHDEFVAAWIFNLLDQEGHDVFWDKLIPDGVDWWRYLRKEIEKTADGGIFILLASVWSLHSLYCLREFNHAVHHKSKAVILRLDRNTPDLDTIGSIQYISLHDTIPPHFNKLQNDNVSTRLVDALSKPAELDPNKHLVNLPPDKSFERALEYLETVVGDIMKKRQWQPGSEAGQRHDELGIQLEILKIVIGDLRS